MVEERNMIYMGAFLALIMLIWVTYSALHVSSSNKLEQNPANYQYYNQQAQASASGCGDLNDLSNIQHLSHHPDRYQECLKLVDPQKFKEATGRDISEFVR